MLKHKKSGKSISIQVDV